MKKKINRMLVLMASLAALATLLMITLIYYDLFKRQMLTDLKAYAHIAGDCRTVQEMEDMGRRMTECGIRMTVVQSSGQVIYDNEADSGQMGNHLNRPEIEKAMQNGEWATVRRSDTVSRDTFYYALRLENNRILRVSQDAGSIYGILGRGLPSLFIVLLVLAGMGLVMAHFLTGKLIAPIEKMASDLEAYDDGTCYEELTPFITTIRQQYHDIMKGARMRQEFTANVSHELKTPLTSITGYAELIETGMASGEETVHFAHSIHSNALRLLTLINDIIRLSELDDSDGQVDMEQLNLYELAKNCVSMMEISADKHRVKLTLRGQDCYVRGNRQMVEELLYNLCDNAIRYNNAGGRVEVEVYPEETGSVLSVRDTGIGIPQEHQKRVFERFYRVDKSRSKSTGGTGLGLAIVKHIVVRHNALIDLVSKEGEGTTIKVVFPPE